jgi:hypothetical protein
MVDIWFVLLSSMLQLSLLTLQIHDFDAPRDSMIEEGLILRALD